MHFEIKCRTFVLRNLTMSQKSNRQASALSRLESQLSSGVKTAKKSSEKVKLSEADKNRIGKEIEILKKTK